MLCKISQEIAMEAELKEQEDEVGANLIKIFTLDREVAG